MRKSLSAALLTATAVGTLATLPAAPAQAQSAACGQAIDAINAAVAAASGNLTPDIGKTLSIKLLAIDASGADRDAIAAYAKALTDEDASADMTGATNAFNAACAS
ncbi:hypothetical protein [Nocardia arthritidis]|uniref:Hemophore-related protein n=1 Tax=Nocardia arthritidis TaxID=228602 RepID=A0A6G9YNI2_9NOCA|nr:hypothetical protein [Nocardia arthritidis]QIS14483.1 hypothetical protein F5544_33235 [Nocardia arthritidis]